MLTRSLLLPALSLVLLGSSIACGGGDEAPAKKPGVEVTPSDPGTSLYSDPSTPPAAPTSTLPPLPTTPVDVDGGGALPADPNAPPPAPSGTTPTPAPSGSTPPPANAACPPGGEMEVEPNDQASPNVLNGVRCGTVAPGDVEYLQVNRQAFEVQWMGAINVQLVQTTLGGPYLLQITSQTPSVPTPWQIAYK